LWECTRRGREEREEGKQRRAERRIFQTEDMTTLVLSSTVLTHLNENAPSTHLRIELADMVPFSGASRQSQRLDSWIPSTVHSHLRYLLQET